MMFADGNKRAAWRREGIASGARRGCSARRPGDGARAGLEGTATRRAATPIWMAALGAAACHATRGGEAHAVRWDCISGRAVYTNAGEDVETIHPLGVSLASGQTLSVRWAPGDTDYTLEVYGRGWVRA